MKVNSLPQPADVPVVSIELTRDEALLVAAIMIQTVRWDDVPLARDIYDALETAVGEPEQGLSYSEDHGLFIL